MLREALTPERLRTMAVDEAAAYFVNRETEGLTPSEHALLSDWLAEAEGHQLAYDRAVGAWRDFDDGRDDEILEAMRAHARSAPIRRWATWRTLAAAATLLFVAATSLTIALQPHIGSRPAISGNQQVARADWTIFRAAHGQVRAVRLADGSMMTLDAESIAKVRFAPTTRSVRLEKGRALFEVAKNPLRPFMVAVADRRVVALGTRFEVDASGGGLRVALFRGKVSVSDGSGRGQSFILHPGQQFVQKAGAASVEAMAPAVGDQPSWTIGLLDFDDTPLAEAVQQLNRYSSAKLVLANPGVGTIRISGQFRARDAERFAGTVAELYPVKVIRRGSALELAPAK